MLFSISNSSMYHSSVSVYQCIPWPVDSVEIRYNPKCCLRLEPVSKLLYKLAWVADKEMGMRIKSYKDNSQWLLLEEATNII